jgi:hypothetical protein
MAEPDLIGTIRNERGDKIDFLRMADIYGLEQLEPHRPLTTIWLSKAELLLLLRLALDNLKVPTDLVDSVVPKLTKANIVK